MEWLMLNMGTIIAGLVLAVLVFFLLHSTLNNRKNGCGNCSGCGGCSACHTKEAKSKRRREYEVK